MMRKFSLLILAVVFIFSSIATALAVDVTWNGFTRYQFVRTTTQDKDTATWRLADYRDNGPWKDSWFMWNAGARVPDVWSDSWIVPLWRGNHGDGTTNDTWLDFKLNAAYSDNTSIMFKFWTKATNDRSWDHEGDCGQSTTQTSRMALGTVLVKTFVDPVDVMIGGQQDEFGVSTAYNYPAIGKFEYTGVKVGIPVGTMKATVGVGTNDNEWLGESNTGGPSVVGTASLKGEMSGAKVGAYLMSSAPNYRQVNAIGGPRTFRLGVDGSKTISGISLSGVLAYIDNGSGIVQPSWDSWMQGYKEIVLGLDAKYPVDALTIEAFIEPTSRTTNDDRPASGGGGPAANETWREAYRPGETYMKLLAGLDLSYKISEKVSAGLRYDWGDNDLSVKKGTEVVMNKPAGADAAGYKVAMATDDVFSRITGRVKWAFDGVNVSLQIARTNYPTDLWKYYGLADSNAISKQQDEIRFIIDTSF